MMCQINGLVKSIRVLGSLVVLKIADASFNDAEVLYVPLDGIAILPCTWVVPLCALNKFTLLIKSVLVDVNIVQAKFYIVDLHIEHCNLIVRIFGVVDICCVC